MTDKERLEEIMEVEEEVGNGFAIEDLDLNTMTVVNREHFNWLIEQAERAQDNDQAIIDLNQHVEELEDENVDLKRENKRYREALHLIMHQYELEEDIPDHDFMWNVNQIARKALKEE